MAVLDKYVDASLVAGKLLAGATSTQGSRLLGVSTTFAVAAADDDGSIFRVIPNIPATAVLRSLRISCDALTGSTAWNVGLYKPGVGNGVAKTSGGSSLVALLASGLNLSAGYSRILGLDGLSAVSIADCTKSLWELGSQLINSRDQAFDIALTATTIGSGAGNVLVNAEFYFP